MKIRYALGLMALVTALVLSACTAVTPVEAQAAPTTDSMDGGEMGDESMGDEKMDDEKMNDESMDGEEMGDESMDGEEMDDESMDGEEMDDEKMDDEEMDGEMMGEPVTFTLTIENISGDSELPSPLAPGAYAVHSGATPLFVAGQADQGLGLEALAEDGDPSGLAAALAGDSAAIHSGVFTTPEGADGPGPLFPGSSYTFTFQAAPGERLSFATMFVQSNDLFFAPDEMGIALFDDEGKPLSEDVTDAVLLWDAGTEVNEEPGVGPNQAPRQAGPNTGEDEMGVVRPVDDGYSYPDVDDLIRVTVTANDME